MSAPPRILVVFGTRPEAIKLFPVIAALRSDARLAVRVCVSGQHRTLLDQVLALAEIRPDHDLGLMRPGQSLDALAAALLTGSCVCGCRPRGRLVASGGATAPRSGHWLSTRR